jgi:hypothetical protein
LTRPMKYELKRVCQAPCEAHRPTEVLAGGGRRAQRRYFAWAGLAVIPILAGQAFAAGVSGAFGQTSATSEFFATARPHGGSQQNASAFKRICWPIEAGVDAQCFDSP